MTKLKKLFPLSFKFCNTPAKLLLGIVIYLAIGTVAGWAISAVSTILCLPLIIFAIPYVGWLLAILLLPILLIYVVVVDLAVAYATSIANIYIYAGIAVAIVAYAKSDDCEKVEAEAETVDAIEEVAEDSAEEAVEEPPEEAVEEPTEETAEPTENGEVEA